MPTAGCIKDVERGRVGVARIIRVAPRHVAVGVIQRRSADYFTLSLHDALPICCYGAGTAELAEVDRDAHDVRVGITTGHGVVPGGRDRIAELEGPAR